MPRPGWPRPPPSVRVLVVGEGGAPPRASGSHASSHSTTDGGGDGDPVKVPRTIGGGGGGGRAGLRNNEWVGSVGGWEVWWFEKVVIGKWREGGGGREEEDRGLERRAVRRGGCKTQKLRFSLACSVEALFTRSECHHELAPMRAHSYVMDGGELQLERATGKTKQQLSESSGSDVSQNEQLTVGFRPRAKSRLLCTTRVRFRLLQLCVCDLGVG